MKNNSDAKIERVAREILVKKLEHLDDRLLSVWLQDEPPLADEERWDIFVTLLETRVSLLKTIRDAGIELTRELCVPVWLERLSSSRLEIRRREIRVLEEERQIRKQMGVYEAVATATSVSKGSSRE